MALLVALETCFCGPLLVAGEGPRYTAVFADGRLLHGSTLTGWGEPGGVATLDGRPLLDPKNLLRWLRDNSLAPAPVPTSPPFVEFISGDCLPGVVVGTQMQDEAGADVPASRCLLVEPRLALRDSNNQYVRVVRVLQHSVRRIVWQRAAVDRHQPGTLVERNGARTAFLRHRFQDRSVKLLLEAGIREIPLRDIAELHLPELDPWDAYFAEVAALSPDLRSPLFRLDTTAGLVVTSSLARSCTTLPGTLGRLESGWQLLQPAWSLEAFAVQDNTACMRYLFPPHDVPLVRVPAVLGEGRIRGTWRPQVNRNVYGGILRSGEQPFGWGFGSHGWTELEFPLPPIPSQFRSRLGLDHASGNGGCSRGLVLCRSGKDSRQLYRSDILVGSRTVADTGRLALGPGSASEPRRLVLAVDSVDQGRPKGADPLDIRDALDWFEPLLALDAPALEKEVRRHVLGRVLPWNGWTLEAGDAFPLRLAGHWEASPGRGLHYRYAVLHEKQPLVLHRSLSVGPSQKWMILTVAQRAREASLAAGGPGGPQAAMPVDHPTIEVQVDGVTKARHEFRAPATVAGERADLVVPLESFLGRQVRLSILQRPVGPSPPELAVDWRGLEFCERLPMLREVFEDALPGAGLAEASAGKIAGGTLINEHAYAGRSCLRLAAGQRCTIPLGESPVAIREHPGPGEYRYLRFAFRKRGQGQVRLELGRAGDAGRSMQYFAGRGKAADASAKRVWEWATFADLPDAWIVVDCDLYGDFGQPAGFELTSISVSCPDGAETLVDHVYLGRGARDLDLVQVPHELAEATNQKARAAMGKSSIDKTLPATVLLQGGERSASGVIVSPDGFVLTAGHRVIGAKGAITVTLANGRQVEGHLRGVDRANNAAMVKIADHGPYPFVEVAAAADDRREELLLGVGHAPDYKPGTRPTAHLMMVRAREGKLFGTNFLEPLIGSGGPLVGASNGAADEGRLVGLHNANGGSGAFYTPIELIHPAWERLKKGEVWGEWGNVGRPYLGLFEGEPQDGKYRIGQILANGPAEKAGLKTGDLIEEVGGQPIRKGEDTFKILRNRDPGEEVILKILREGRPLDIKVVLGVRR